MHLTESAKRCKYRVDFSPRLKMFTHVVFQDRILVSSYGDERSDSVHVVVYASGYPVVEYFYDVHGDEEVATIDGDGDPVWRRVFREHDLMYRDDLLLIAHEYDNVFVRGLYIDPPPRVVRRSPRAPSPRSPQPLSPRVRSPSPYTAYDSD